MSDISSSIRERRFNLIKDHPVRFEVDTNTGTRLELKLQNCSLSGIGATIQISEEVAILSQGDIIPAAKIHWAGNEIALGRLVLRYKRIEQGQVYLGLSPIDSKVPVAGPLSAFLDSSFSEVSNPFDFELSNDKFSLADFYMNNDRNVDILAKTKQYAIFHQDWVKSNKFSYTNVRLESKGTRVKLQRSRKGNRNDYLVMSSNDYLGLSAHPAVIEATKKAVDKYGLGSTGAPVLTGLADVHIELESEIAKIFGKESALLYNSGYTANIAAISSIVGINDLAVGDMLVHGSMMVGMEMSKGTKRYYRHNSVKHLDKLLTEARPAHAGCLVLTEGVFSMDGDEAPLSEVVKVCRKHKARLFVDEAHSFGVIGKTGLGSCEKHNVLDDVEIIMGNLSKMGGSMGGFIAGDRDLIYWLRSTSYAYIQSSYLPPAIAAGSLEALRVFQSSPELVNTLQNNIKHFGAGLRGLGFEVDENHESAVFPVVVRDINKIGKMKEVLYDNGVFVSPIVFPSVGKNNARFRFALSALHTTSDLDFALNVLEMAMVKADFSPNRQIRIDEAA